MTSLTPDALYFHNKQRSVRCHRTDKRIVMCTLGGTQVGLLGVGENLGEGCDQRLTFPSHWSVGTILKNPMAFWARFAIQEELAGGHPSWYVRLVDDIEYNGQKPISIVSSQGHLPEDIVLGSLGIHIVNVVFCSNEEVDEVDEVLRRGLVPAKVKPPADVDGVQTPPTPPMSEGQLTPLYECRSTRF